MVKNNKSNSFYTRIIQDADKLSKLYKYLPRYLIVDGIKIYEIDTKKYMKKIDKPLNFKSSEYIVDYVNEKMFKEEE